MSNNRAYLVVKPADLRGMALQADRDFLSRPVPVEILWCHVTRCRRIVQVRDLVRHIEFPADRGNLKSEFQLTNRQRNAAHGAERAA